jgi:hypothetical protein
MFAATQQLLQGNFKELCHALDQSFTAIFLSDWTFLKKSSFRSKLKLRFLLVSETIDIG